MKHPRSISEPEHFSSATRSFEDSLGLYRIGLLSSAIQRPMLVTPIRRMLRAIYGGSNLQVAWHLLWHALREKCSETTLRWRLALGIIPGDLKTALAEDEEERP